MAAHVRRSISMLDRRALVRAALLAVVAGLPAAMAQAPAGAELVMFVEPGCPWCRRWDEEVGLAFSRSAEARRAPLRRIHIAEARQVGFRLSAPVTVTPTFVLVDRGAEVGRITGYPGADFFWSMLDGLLAKLPQAPAAPLARDAGLAVSPNGLLGGDVALAVDGQSYC